LNKIYGKLNVFKITEAYFELHPKRKISLHTIFYLLILMFPVGT